MSDVRIDRVRVGITNTYLLRGRTGAVLIDPGEPGASRKVLRKLRARAGSLSDVGLIVTTHGHYDHFGCGAEVRSALGSKIVVHEGDSKWMSEGILAIPPGLTAWGRCLHTVARGILPTILHPKPIEPDLIATDDERSLLEYGVAGRIVHTPGHTPGSLSVLLDSGEVFVGDTAMNLIPFCVRPSLPCIGDDLDVMRRSWRRLLGLGARVVYPGHGAPFPVEALHAQLEP